MRRLTGAGVLAAWAGLFWYLLFTGRWSLFLADRVQWIVPVAAVVFTLSALGCALARSDERGPLDLRHAWGFALGIAPVLLILLVPLDTLSSFAASRRTDFAAAQFSTSASLEQGKPLTFQGLVGAGTTEQGRAALAQRQGEPVRLVGLTMSPRAEGFDLTRFVVACCVVDASVLRVPVVGAPPGGEGTWVEVDGRLAVDAHGKPVVQAVSVTPVEQPDPPYLSPSAG
jgi:uncharacterized repeat protein (TIGR03943 family)